MITNGTTPAGSGTLRDIANLAKSRYPGNVEMQAKYIQAAVDLIKRDHPDEVQTLPAQWNGKNLTVTMFPSEGMVYAWWTMSTYSSNLGCGLEIINPSNRRGTLIFTSASGVYNSIIEHLI